MSGYGEDRSELTANLKTLEEAFNLDSSSREQTLSQIQQMRDNLEEAVQGRDPDDILKTNIERAERLLDLAEAEITNGGMNARLLEVCGQLINAITSASTSIVGSSFNDAQLEYKQKMLELKEKEIMVKQAIAVGKQQPRTINTTNNLIIADRESVLDMIRKQKTIEVSTEGE